MADNKKSKFIRFGDYVVLRGEQIDKKNEQKIEGFLSAQGFTDNKIYF